jgi:hypothetical protein
LHGWKQQPDQGRDDGDHDQKLHKRETNTNAARNTTDAWN